METLNVLESVRDTSCSEDGDESSEECENVVFVSLRQETERWNERRFERANERRRSIIVDVTDRDYLHSLLVSHTDEMPS